MLHSEKLNAKAKAFVGLNHEALEDTVLATIINRKVEDVALLKEVKLERHFKLVSLHQALNKPSRGFILECKQSSPTLGDFCQDFDLDKLLNTYNRYGAAISVLCEKHFFKGSLDYLNYVKARTALPVICKDFIICKEQIMHAYNAGADAILLMLSVLDKALFKELYTYARSLGLEVLCEVENSTEALYAKEQNFPIVGINNRDLKTLKIDLTKALKLSKLFDDKTVIVSESGIKTHADIVALKPLKNFLIGSSLTSERDVEFKAKTLLFGLNKICGLKTREAIEACIDNHAAIGGLIFAPKSPRFIDKESALALIAPYRGKIKFAGVFVNEDIDLMVKIAKELQLDYLQLHGTESLDTIKDLKAQLPHIGIIKAFAIENQDSFEKVRPYEDLCDLLLLDSKSPGSGSSFNWKAIPNFINKNKSLLSGGIGFENLEEALDCGFAGLDLNSKLESVKGLKDPQKVAQALRIITKF